MMILPDLSITQGSSADRNMDAATINGVKRPRETVNCYHTLRYWLRGASSWRVDNASHNHIFLVALSWLISGFAEDPRDLWTCSAHRYRGVHCCLSTSVLGFSVMLAFSFVRRN